MAAVLRPAKRPTTRRQSTIAAATALGALLVVFAIVAFMAGWLGSRVAQNDAPNRSGDTALLEPKSDGNQRVTSQEASISAVVDKAGPSVVSITTASADYARGRVLQGAGTGMIISKDGYILTNKHVVGDADRVTVTMSDGTIFNDVEVVGADKLNDVAFLKIAEVKNLPAITLGDSNTVRVGQEVVAIGNALGQFDNTVTSGIISGKGRPLVATSANGTSAEQLSDLLQTDAAINGGNSGGPLLNLEGQVIGINTAVAAEAQGIGFAIPISSTKGMIRELFATGEVRRAFLGVRYVSISPEVKAEYNLSVRHGDLVTADGARAVQAGGPADKAGVREGDIIVAADGAKVEPGSSISTLIGEKRPGETVELTIVRDGNEITTTVKLGSY